MFTATFIALQEHYERWIRGGRPSQKVRRELLLKAYSAALDECRFNVQLSWDRTKFFLLLNSGLIAAGMGLLKVGQGSVLQSLFLIFFFSLVGRSGCIRPGFSECRQGVLPASNFHENRN